jgi:hypothetical protein
MYRKVWDGYIKKNYHKTDKIQKKLSKCTESDVPKFNVKNNIDIIKCRHNLTITSFRS